MVKFETLKHLSIQDRSIVLEAISSMAVESLVGQYMTEESIQAKKQTLPEYLQDYFLAGLGEYLLSLSSRSSLEV